MSQECTTEYIPTERTSPQNCSVFMTKRSQGGCVWFLLNKLLLKVPQKSDWEKKGTMLFPFFNTYRG